ncbi:MAG: phenylalanine--tRNA ligase subunit beta [Patescibacteria group bacterium]|nr:phenylalanine--tRNA ligase subunit beta [Patescibacteria group bacterium]
MKFRIKDLEKYTGKISNWQKVADTLTLKSFETNYTDGIIDVDILPNRYPDASCLLGLANEILLVTNKPRRAKLEIKKPKESKEKTEGKLKVVNELSDEVPYYFGRVILGLKNQPSPSWLKEFVEFYGFRSINFLVDLSNLVMIETGAPLHIFDLDKINDQVIVRKAKDGEKFISLDRKVYNLNKEDIVIADRNKIIALAGINGSSLSEVDLNTKNIFIEAAVFSPEAIYKTSRRLNLKTTSAFRFERKVSPSRSRLALERVTYLINIYLGGVVLAGIIGDRKMPIRQIKFDFSLIEKISGLRLDNKLIKKILDSLNIKKNGNILILPSDRLDLQTPEDIVEEIIRLYDYNKIKPFYEYSFHRTSIEKHLEFNNLIKNFFLKVGYFEGYNYSFFNKEYYLLIKEMYPSAVKVYNPISEDHEYFQNNLIPSLLKNVYLNQFNFKKIRLFQIDKVACEENEKIVEKYHLGVVYADKDPELILKELKGILTKLSNEFNFNLELVKFHSTLFGKIGARLRGLGFMGVLTKNMQEKFDFDLNLGIIEIDLDELIKIVNLRKMFQPIPIFSVIERDLSFFVENDMTFSEISKQIRKLKVNFLKEIKLIDIYFIAKKSLTIRFVFYSESRNLTNEEVDKEIEKIKIYLVDTLKVELR